MMRKYKPFNYCAVCGHSMEGKIPYYPYGYTEIPYCETCAATIIRNKDQRRANARRSEEKIRERIKEGEKVETLAQSYYVSESFIRALVKGKENV